MKRSEAKREHDMAAAWARCADEADSLKDAWEALFATLDGRGLPFDTVAFRTACDTARGLIANSKISGGTPSAESDCSACFGRGYIYGPTNAYPITEAQEEPEILDCTVCRGTGKKPNAQANGLEAAKENT